MIDLECDCPVIWSAIVRVIVRVIVHDVLARNEFYFRCRCRCF